ncbi:Abi family protein [Salmonella enterica subsp. enterica serovar Hillingdon]|uniref:Abi family protein n=1 Tax=Salmonella enterica TaxID=28901 RepID=UPI0009AFE8F9|nr:Abi family protein [Salmonella enterica]EBW2268495.1 Abi family protein [Salmonella enterica subsp. enterica serovar Hillingdon]ECB6312648.1 Abi family protein [Salmonella enterica subsp. enterica serovar Chailey]EDR0865617.1 Abi family protein [Salmonella enterica subsp. enterica serovar Hillingdon]EDR6326909.1 Abi family protein [Salmonella enterica subsp. enterica serovar Hillingdon]
MTISAIINSISQQRFSTYKTNVFNGITDEECLGIYLWNKQIASAFLPALQILEVSLRNAIYQAKIQYEEDEIERNHPPTQWSALKAAIDRSWFITVMTAANNAESFRQIKAAKKQIDKEKKAHTPENYIAKLTLGFWVSLVDKDFSTPNSTYLTLWPRLRNRVFPGAISDKGTPLSINRIGADLRDINKIRNRLSHHEPLWRTSTTYNVEQAINKLIKDYKKCLDVIRWINPSNLKLLNIIDNTETIRKLCNLHALWRNKQLPSGIPTLPIIDADVWCAPLLMNSRLGGEILNINTVTGFSLIRCLNNGQKFIAWNADFSGKIALYKVGDQVTFEPNSPSTGPLPVAKSVRH